MSGPILIGLGWEVTLIKGCFLGNCMKCRKLQKSHVYQPPPFMEGGRDGRVNWLECFAWNWIKYSNMQKGVIFPNTAPNRVGVESILKIKFLLGIVWNIQIYTETSCLPTLIPLAVGYRCKVNLEKKCFTGNWINSKSAQKSYLPALYPRGGRVRFHIFFLQGLAWSVWICTEELCLPIPIPNWARRWTLIPSQKYFSRNWMKYQGQYRKLMLTNSHPSWWWGVHSQFSFRNNMMHPNLHRKVMFPNPKTFGVRRSIYNETLLLEIERNIKTYTKTLCFQSPLSEGWVINLQKKKIVGNE